MTATTVIGGLLAAVLVYIIGRWHGGAKTENAATKQRIDSMTNNEVADDIEKRVK